MQKQSKQLNIRLDYLNHEAVKAYSEAKGITVSALITHLILHHLPIASFHKGKKLGLKKNKITLALSKKQTTALELRTIEQGYEKETQYIYSLLSSVLFNKARLNKNELNTVDKAVLELNSIGRNLNQVAKALNTNWVNKDQEQVQIINEALKDIKQLNQTIKQAELKILTLIVSGHERFKHE